MAWKGSATAVTIADDALTTLATIKVREGASNLWAEVANSAHSTFDKFSVAYRVHSDGSYVVIADAPSDFASNLSDVAPPVRKATKDLTTLAKSTSAILWLDVKGVQSVRLQAESTGTSDTTASVYWQVR